MLTLQLTYSQNKLVNDSLKAVAKKMSSDTLAIKLITEPTTVKQFDIEKNLPWIGAVLVSLLTIFANIYISRKSRKETKESLNRQLESSGATTDKQLNNAKDIAISQIENSRKIVQLDFNKTVLSGNRQAWINTLRDAISEYIAMCNTYSIKLDQIKSKGKEAAQNADTSDLKEILRLEFKIVLMVNSNEEDSKQLINQLGLYTKALFGEPAIMQEPESIQQSIVEITKTILKKEWERVKKGE